MRPVAGVRLSPHPNPGLHSAATRRRCRDFFQKKHASSATNWRHRAGGCPEFDSTRASARRPHRRTCPGRTPVREAAGTEVFARHQPQAIRGYRCERVVGQLPDWRGHECVFEVEELIIRGGDPEELPTTRRIAALICVEDRAAPRVRITNMVPSSCPQIGSHTVVTPEDETRRSARNRDSRQALVDVTLGLPLGFDQDPGANAFRHPKHCRSEPIHPPLSQLPPARSAGPIPPARSRRPGPAPAGAPRRRQSVINTGREWRGISGSHLRSGLQPRPKRDQAGWRARRPRRRHRRARGAGLPWSPCARPGPAPRAPRATRRGWRRYHGPHPAPRMFGSSASAVPEASPRRR